ncbi:HD domain-containing protein [Carnobacteriaceae bacterium zg-ZUI252]|nr:HD domain-containing protein [Carnobacteriaceae bacterium zg-ZUI252]MBS4769957.1 HD domain-containing protein [Carnobacteriaceae bacterium zg-ZUI240]QTU83364.1 HD domain-containing protein [Carnobacteriaceae bacterium zg-C25]
MEKQLHDYQVGEDMLLPLLIKSADVRMTKDQKAYIAFTFQDKSGQMDAKLWGATPQQIEQFISGVVVQLAGKREVYNNTPQIRIAKLTLLEHANIDEFVQRVGMDAKAIEEEINASLFGITDASIARITRHIYKKYKQQFYEYPAAKRHHHAMVGGLSFHTLSMLRIANHLLTLYPQLSRSLLTAGIMLHDIGKVIELSGAISTEYTLPGNLLGHIVIMSDEITKACIELDIDDTHESVVLLKHVVLAHHGKLEYGSPVRPLVMEAELIHHIDMIDATMNMLTTSLEKVEVGTFGDKIYGLDNRMFFQHGIQ